MAPNTPSDPGALFSEDLLLSGMDRVSRAIATRTAEVRASATAALGPGAALIEHTIADAGIGPAAGVDEAGRGACAGPISIAACILPSGPLPELALLTDSKKLTARRREELCDVIRDVALAYSVIHIDPGAIDAYGLQWANVEGMRMAIESLEVTPGFVLSDAVTIPDLPMPQEALTRGDALCRCISAASVLAKVSRDRLMAAYEAEFPGYGFAGHKGYGTKAHMDAVSLQGPSPLHRYTYSNVAAAAELYAARTGTPAPHSP